MQQNSPEKAAEIYRTLVAVAPSSPDYRWSLAEVLAETQGVAQSLQALGEGVAVTPASIDMHMRPGCLSCAASRQGGRSGASRGDRGGARNQRLSASFSRNS
jgi:predicted Zn-dependent protease